MTAIRNLTGAQRKRVSVGMTFFAIYADSRPEWTVIKRRGNGAWDCVIKEDDWTGAKKVFGSEEILAAVREDTFFNNLVNATGDWWNQRKIGEILHYHNSFGQYVRGRVIDDNGEKKLQPIALVGPWKTYDLPRRMADGSISYPYHAEKIINQTGAWQPSHTNMFEHPDFSGPVVHQRIDPRVAPAIDLSVADMNDDAKEIARLEIIRKTAIMMLENPSDNLKITMTSVVNLLMTA
jgi:hypothetical protein